MRRSSPAPARRCSPSSTTFSTSRRSRRASSTLEQGRVEPAQIVSDVLGLFWERAASKSLDLAAHRRSGRSRLRGRRPGAAQPGHLQPRQQCAEIHGDGARFRSRSPRSSPTARAASCSSAFAIPGSGSPRTSSTRSSRRSARPTARPRGASAGPASASPSASGWCTRWAGASGSKASRASRLALLLHDRAPTCCRSPTFRPHARRAGRGVRWSRWKAPRRARPLA